MYFTKEDFQLIEAWFKVNAWKDTDFTRISPEDMGNEDIIAVVHDGTNCAIPYTDLIGYITDIVNPSEIVTVPSYNDLPNPGEENNLYIIASTGALYRYGDNIYHKVGLSATSAGLGLKIDSNGNLNINLLTDEHRDDDQYTLEIEDKETEAKVLDIVIPPADTSYAGVMTAQDKINLDNAVNKLSGIEDNANNYTLLHVDLSSTEPLFEDVFLIANSDSISWHQGIGGWEAYVKNADDSVVGGVALGYIPPLDTHTYPLLLDPQHKAYVNILDYTNILTSSDVLIKGAKTLNSSGSVVFNSVNNNIVKADVVPVSTTSLNNISNHIIGGIRTYDDDVNVSDLDSYFYNTASIAFGNQEDQKGFLGIKYANFDGTDYYGGVLNSYMFAKLYNLPTFAGVTTKSSQGDGALYIDNPAGTPPILTQRIVYGLKDNYNSSGTKLDYYGVTSGAKMYNIDLMNPQIYVRIKLNTDDTEYYYQFNRSTHEITVNWVGLYNHGYLYYNDYTLCTNNTKQAQVIGKITEAIEVRGTSSTIPNNYRDTVKVYINMAPLCMKYQIPGPREYAEWAVPTYGTPRQIEDYVTDEGEHFNLYVGEGTLDILLPQLTILLDSLKAHVIFYFTYKYYIDTTHYDNDHIIYNEYIFTNMKFTGIEG